MNKIKGFSLIEVMVVVTIIAVLSTMAYSSYSKSVAKGRRGAAKSFVMEIAQREQQYLLDQRSYVTGITSCGGLTALGFSASQLPPSTTANEATKYYTCAVAAGATTTPPTFTITLTPTGRHARDEATQPSQGRLTIDQAGTKTGAW